VRISVHIDLAPEDTWTMPTTEAADAVLKALGGDETKDFCEVLAHASGNAGTLPPPPVAPAV